LQHALKGEVGLVGALRRGWWKPDLFSSRAAPEISSVSTAWRSGVKLLGGGAIHTLDAAGAPVVNVFVHLETVDGVSHTVYPELVARLSSLCLFRKRDPALLMVLRNRALDWGRSVGISSCQLAPGLPSSVVLACVVGSSEEAALETGRALGVSGCFSDVV